jgi:uncharacterized caspase-like protein
MLRRILLLALCAVSLAVAGRTVVTAQQTEPRIALVVGNAAYAPGALPTALNDAGLVAEALRSIGFEIVEGADLSQPDMLRVFREFIAKVDAAGPDALAFVYFSGNALSFEGENYLLGTDARLARESDIPIEGVRLTDLLRPLTDSPARAKVIMIDAARLALFRPQGRGLAPGLEALEAPQGMLLAYSSGPGTVAPDGPGPYGAYATAIAEMLRAPGIDLNTAFTHIRSRTHLSTQGQQTPWHVANLSEPIELVPPDAASAALPPPPPPRAAQPMRALGVDEGYALAIETDSLDRYVEFVDAYPDSPYSDRVWAMIRARREALVWMRALQLNTPQAYWTYLQRYPGGIYAYDAERRLRRLSAPLAPPVGFAMLALAGLPLALRNEPREYRPIYRVGPPPPRLLMRPPPAFLVNLPPPAPRQGGQRMLPGPQTPIPVVPRLAPAPRVSPSPGTATAPSTIVPQGSPPAGGRPAGQPGGPAASAPAGTATAPSTIAPPQGGPPPGRRPGQPGSPATNVPSGTATAPGTIAPQGAPPVRGRPAGQPGGPAASAPAGTATAPSTIAPQGGPPVRGTPAGQPGSPAASAPAGTATAPGTIAPQGGPPVRGRPVGQPGSPAASAPAGPPSGGPAATRPQGLPPSGAGPAASKPPGPPPGAPGPSASKPPGPPPGPPPGARPSGPPPGPPQTASKPPVVPPAARPVPPPAPPAPPPPRVASPPPPPPPQQRPQGAPPGQRPPSCPPGKTLRVVNGQPVCA